ncbi:hypothetical protein SAMN02745146_2223 [Hymenobacter daecheongensis DSM 21074]|uniref:Uncharacterized protein n=1 Tax=Hymenobacter daecheongensis DSM 21074 TaxID=1121955 RepID=A0A1M6GE01_9BACT|nr:hypothetical protein [Hymenobacter daecheongensis]SHJ08127.1 hypothetical protein SAMN02745146_2223 [Hymenobacter daecheongensis DSM 21074]
MELDDFRRQWQQQPAPGGAPHNEDALRALLAQCSGTPVARMLHNARTEIIATAVSLGIGATLVLLVGIQRLQPFGLLLLGTAVLTGYDYYHKRRLLRELPAATGGLRSHIARQLQSLRGVLRLNYRFTMATLLITIGFLLTFAYTQLPQLFLGDARTLGQRGLWLVLTVLASGLITHWLIRWTLQQQYGRHLDQLETALRELEETP